MADRRSGAVTAAPAVVGNSVYGGSGYSRLGLGTSTNTFCAFTVGAAP